MLLLHKLDRRKIMNIWHTVQTANAVAIPELELYETVNPGTVIRAR